MEPILFLLLVGFVLILAGVHFRNRAEKKKLAISEEFPDLPVFWIPVEFESDDADRRRLLQILGKFPEISSKSEHPLALRRQPEFQEGVRILNRGLPTEKHLLLCYPGPNSRIAILALEALLNKDDGDDFVEVILEDISEVQPWVAYFATRLIAHRAKGPVIPSLLLRVDLSWLEDLMINALRDFFQTRLSKGEEPTFGEKLGELGRYQVTTLRELFDRLEDSVPAQLKTEVFGWSQDEIDGSFFEVFGRVWSTEKDQTKKPLVEHEELVERVNLLDSLLHRQPPKSALLIGENGVGKTSAIRSLTKKLAADGWMVFEAGAADLLSGQIYIGALEERVKQLVENLRGKQILWFIPNFHELYWVGRHHYSSSSVIDWILPYLEDGVIRIIGETTPSSLEKLSTDIPKLLTSFEVIRFRSLPEQKTLQVARAWLDAGGGKADEQIEVDDRVLLEAQRLVQHYLGSQSSPGSLLEVLERTVDNAHAAGAGPKIKLKPEDLLVTLSRTTGLPLEILDDAKPLNLDGLRSHFEKRVMGQPEAIDCLVERVAMIKAGLTDPSRPEGVFLFVGPTGTGKTEIAKTLAEFLFGSAERMIRLDMSEFQTPESMDRIYGEKSSLTRGSTLVSEIRKQPFSVVLLDEIEKAHPNVWDLFLQVFDDGRLTDSRGNVADFRHSILIMTSNVGATAPRDSNIGFASGGSTFAEGAVRRAVEDVFRREFINRIDRIVVFRPLGQRVLRELLQKELGEVLQRRGLRSRSWAVEWDESAIEFLLAKGYSAQLGARPLKRAIEQYLLSPLATTIVRHQVPEGDQFLFVRSDQKSVQVEFVDPDAPEESPDETSQDAASPALLQLERIALTPQGRGGEVELLDRIYAEISTRLASGDWKIKKEKALGAMSRPDFWSSNGRFSILSRAEYMDRIEAGARTAGSLLQRLHGNQSANREYFPKDLVGRMARQLFLIRAASEGVDSNTPTDAFLSVRTGRSTGADQEKSVRFARKLGAMYKSWAEKRRMHITVLEESEDRDDRYRLLLAVSGFAAYSLLAPESGIHVFETPKQGGSFDRVRVVIVVVPQPDTPAGQGKTALHNQAVQTLASQLEKSTRIVRRYREKPKPIVRDTPKGWRTSQLDRVLGGDFDLMT